MSVCIDRTNFDTAQRKHWVNIAREFPGTLIWVIVFDTPYEVCRERIQKRISHPTIKSPEQGLSVLQRFATDFQSPQPSEGFDRILCLNTTVFPTPIFSRSDIAEILQRVRNSASLNVGRIQPVWSLYPKHQQRGFGRGRFGTSNNYGHSFQWSRGRGRAGTGPSNPQAMGGPTRITRRDTPIGGWRTGNKNDPSAVD
ncbi:hypothetical protein WG66_001799 [Moniliophthora roreri]|nr:hypothetical protein WG66_001799 [Moniliophthora roreri]